MKRYLFIIICLFLLSPILANAQEYTFNVCKSGCEWNEENYQDLDWNYMQNNYPDFNEDEDKVIIVYGDGNYSFYEPIVLGFNMQYNFGKGIYNFNDFDPCEIEYLSLIGIGSKDTKINVTDELELVEDTVIKISDLTINISDTATGAYIGAYYSGSDEIIIPPEIYINNSIISNNSYNFGIWCYANRDNGKCDINFDNVTIKSNNLLSLSHNNVSSPITTNIKNSDLSNTDFFIESPYFVSNKTDVNININNTKLKRVYVNYDATLNIDCNSTFIGGIKKTFGGMNSATFFSQNEYNLYGAWSDKAGQYGKIVTETCEDKNIKINRKISLRDIKEEFGYDIDDTWTFDPEGIMEIRNNELVPLKVGKTKLSKEINDEIKTLRLEVTSIDKSNKNIVNPKTMAPILIILLLALLTLPVTIFYKNKSMN